MNSIGIKYLTEYINMNKILTLFSYLLTIFKVVLIFLSILFIDDLIPLGLNVFVISPMYTLVALLFATVASYSAGQLVFFYPAATLLTLLIISWILTVIMLFPGLKSKKARKVLFTLSILTAIPDLLLSSGIVLQLIATDISIDPLYVLGIALALCSITVNVICLRSNNEA